MKRLLPPRLFLLALAPNALQAWLLPGPRLLGWPWQVLGVVPMLADWTARDAVTGRLIEKLAPGASIPLAAVFPAGRPDQPIVMLGIVTRQQVVDNLAKASSPEATHRAD